MREQLRSKKSIIPNLILLPQTSPLTRSPELSDEQKVFLFLQGPNCSFFKGVGEKLRGLGHTCFKISLSAGGSFYWGGPSIHYRGSYKEWGSFLSKILEKEKVTDIVLNGDQRLYHKVAIRLAQKRSIRIAAADFGYLRPDWITLESHGTLGNSGIPKSLPAIRSMASKLELPDLRPLFNDSGFRFALAEAVGGGTTWFFKFLYPRYRPFGIHHPILHGLAFVKTFIKKKFLSPLTQVKLRATISNVGYSPYYLFPMQLEGDFQIRSHSNYSTQVTALEEVMDSFAEYAPENSLLVFKQHPLEPDFRGWRGVVDRLALEIGIQERVVFLREGSIATLLDTALGVVTINSTVGLEAVRSGKKVKALGKAVYDVPGIVFEGILNDFWRSEFSPDPEDVQSFLKILVAMTQVRGNWFSDEGLAMAIDGTVERLHHGTVGKIDSMISPSESKLAEVASC